jgi:pentatricopeptide repeat protein
MRERERGEASCVRERRSWAGGDLLHVWLLEHLKISQILAIPSTPSLTSSAFGPRHTEPSSLAYSPAPCRVLQPTAPPPCRARLLQRRTSPRTARLQRRPSGGHGWITAASRGKANPLARANIGRCFVGDGPLGRKERWAGHALPLRAPARAWSAGRSRKGVSFNIKDGDFSLARRLFDAMPSREVTSWNVMLTGYCHSRQMVDATNLFEQTSGVWCAYARRSFFFTIMIKLDQKIRLNLVYKVYSTLK